MTIVIPVLYFGKEGGFRVLSKLADYFINANHRAIFLAPQSSEQPYYTTNATIYWYSKSGKFTQQKPQRIKQMSTAFKMVGLSIALNKLAKTEKIDVVLANLYLTTFPVWLAQPAKAILFYYIQFYEPEAFQNKKGYKNYLGYQLAKWSYRLPFHQIVNANYYQDYKELKTNRVVFPGLDLQLYKSVERRSFMEDGVLRIGTIGRTEEWKGTAEVIAAYRQLLTLQLPVELYLAFGSEMMTENLPGITIVHPHGDKNLASFYKQIDVYVSAVLVNGPAIHYPVVEAMASGTLVITTHLYPADVANTIIIDSQHRAVGVGEGILQLLKPGDKAQRQQRVENALQAVQQFDWNTVGDKMLDYFKAVKPEQQ